MSHATRQPYSLYLYAIANFDLALSFAPNFHKTKIPIIPMTDSPANKVVPLATPRLMNSGRAKRIEPQASADLKKSLPANNDAAYCGYDSGTIRVSAFALYKGLNCTTHSATIRVSVMSAREWGWMRCQDLP